MSPSAPSLHFAPGKAIAYSLSAIICLSVLDALVKWLAADYAITQIVGRVQAILRSYDVCARWGGDEFILLIDDCVDSRWTITVAARELRRAGSGPVLPFALAVVA